jgi:glutathione S-transferase
MARPALRQPGQPLELYDFEACPYCRLVREAFTQLDLDVLIHPCPKGGTRYRPVVKKLGGKTQFPFLVDPNTGEQMYESADIVGYLYRGYGGRRPPRRLLAGIPSLAGAYVASGLRRLHGMRARPSRPPGKSLELYSFESSPYSRLVRETLCELEIPYLLRNFGKAVGPDLGPPWVRTRFFPNTPIEGRNRRRMHEQTGRLQAPFLIDPNTGDELYESRAIIDYLNATYGA